MGDYLLEEKLCDCESALRKAEARVRELEAQVEREVACGMEFATKAEKAEAEVAEMRKLCGEVADDTLTRRGKLSPEAYARLRFVAMGGLP